MTTSARSATDRMAPGERRRGPAAAPEMGGERLPHDRRVAVEEIDGSPARHRGRTGRDRTATGPRRPRGPPSTSRFTSNAAMRGTEFEHQECRGRPSAAQKTVPRHRPDHGRFTTSTLRSSRHCRGHRGLPPTAPVLPSSGRIASGVWPVAAVRAWEAQGLAKFREQRYRLIADQPRRRRDHGCHRRSPIAGMIVVVRGRCGSRADFNQEQVRAARLALPRGR